MDYDYDLKIVFLDVLDYLNVEAKRIGFSNCKGMIRECANEG